MNNKLFILQQSLFVMLLGIYTQAAYIKLISNFADTVSITTNTGSELTKTSLTLFPNPSYGKLFFSGMEKVTNISVFSMNGELLARNLIPAGNEIDISHLACGLYFISIIDNHNNTLCRKISIIH